MLLRIREQLIRLRPNLPPLIIRQLVTHLLNENQQRPTSTFAITAPLCHTSRALKDRFRLLSTP
jgi:hypothetical protein